MIELANHGFHELALLGLPAFREHFRLYSAVLNVSDELGPEIPTASDPLTADFWSSEYIRRDRARLTHRIKTIYGFKTLTEYASDSDRMEQVRAKFRYLM